MNDRGDNDLEEIIHRMKEEIIILEKKLDLANEEIQILNIQLTKRSANE
tara:strand:+ start:4283 stop:4429 length:147 start_codon:yes stop_codon:yes gene_type:complete